jgi:hypothetical protein
MADYLPIESDHSFTSTTSAAVTGGQVLAVSAAGTVAPAGANVANSVGVAAFDVAASGGLITYYRGGVQEVVASGSIAAGDNISTAASGQVATTTSTNPVIGVALTAATTGNKVQVLFNR